MSLSAAAKNFVTRKITLAAGRIAEGLQDHWSWAIWIPSVTGAMQKIM